MKKFMFSLGFAALALGATAQVKIKDGSVTGSSVTPNTNAILELESKQRGLLYPRVALTSTASASPLSAHVKGMVVYDTVSNGSGATAVSPGIYYNDGTQWVRATQPNDWLVLGNAARNGTPAGNTDSQYVMGRVAIGQSTPASVASATSSSSTAARNAYLTVTGGDAYINGLTVGTGGGQSYNTVLGYQALYNNSVSSTGGSGNTAIGYQVLYNSSNNNSAQNNTSNTGVGYQALYNNNGSNGGGAGNVSGGYNTAVGTYALWSNTTGSYNTAVGAGAGQNVTTGKYNILLGSSSYFVSNNSTGISITTESNNIIFGSLQDIMTTGVSNQLNIGGAILGINMIGNQGSPKGNIGIAAVPNASYALNVGGNININGTITATSSTITVPSDRRIKKDVETFTDGLNVITKLKPVTFHYNEKSGLDQQTKHVGFIAQDVEKVAPYMVTTIDDSKGASGLSDKRELDMGALNQLLVNAVQEQQKEIEQLKKEIEALKK